MASVFFVLEARRKLAFVSAEKTKKTALQKLPFIGQDSLPGSNEVNPMSKSKARFRKR
jgi:hypothetical protein